ncbi:hypothetical protein SKAU_G00099880 [Synaphobranchus kaupii]|uniref:Uncharacterized protein n=1 Tax=Synaphobranchus kaupii TaxID=118154 RepID=A0A9Q1J556_SYNKA|nr:hypothetical protein SKAU_G00099880 [Synaphobranchus kaupii]
MAAEWRIGLCGDGGGEDRTVLTLSVIYCTSPSLYTSGSPSELDTRLVSPAAAEFPQGARSPDPSPGAPAFHAAIRTPVDTTASQKAATDGKSDAFEFPRDARVFSGVPRGSGGRARLRSQGQRRESAGARQLRSLRWEAECGFESNDRLRGSPFRNNSHVNGQAKSGENSGEEPYRDSPLPRNRAAPSVEL